MMKPSCGSGTLVEALHADGPASDRVERLVLPVFYHQQQRVATGVRQLSQSVCGAKIASLFGRSATHLSFNLSARSRRRLTSE